MENMSFAVPRACALDQRTLRLCALASGSRGNCIYVGCGDTHLLIDCGIAQRGIAAGLGRVGQRLGAQLGPEALSAVLVSHEHSDHILSLAGLALRHDLPIYASAPTLDAIRARPRADAIPVRNLRAIEPGQDFYIGDIDITPFRTPHDAACPVGYRLDAGEASVAVATDIGRLSDSWLDAVEGAQLVLLEANHDEAMLRAGDYPEALKRRILSARGHLSNELSARAAVRLARSGTRVILLSHLSEHNNTPRLAYDTVCAALEDAGMRPGRDVFVGLLEQNHASDVFELACQ